MRGLAKLLLFGVLGCGLLFAIVIHNDPEAKQPIGASSGLPAEVKPETPSIATPIVRHASGCDDKQQSEDMADAVAGNPFRDPITITDPEAALVVQDGAVKAIKTRTGYEIPVCVFQTSDFNVYIPGSSLRARLTPQTINQSAASFTVKLVIQFKSEDAQSAAAASIIPAPGHSAADQPAPDDLKGIRFLVQDTLYDMDRKKALSFDRQYLDEAAHQITVTDNRLVVSFDGKQGYIEHAGIELERLFDESQRAMRIAKGGSIW